jgi:hypothetical protein
MPYFSGAEKLKNTIKTAHLLLTLVPALKKLFPKPATLAFSRGPNLSNLVAKKSEKRPKTNSGPRGSFPCEKFATTKKPGRPCDTCKMHKESTSITAPNTGEVFKIQGHNTCETEKLVYFLKCLHCDAHYIGKTINTLRMRMNGHRSLLSQKNSLPVYQHPHKNHCEARKNKKATLTNSYSVQVLKSFPKNTTDATIRHNESAYIHIFQAREGSGLNIHM